MNYQISKLQLKDTPCPRFHYNNRSTGQSPYPSYADGTLKWSLVLGEVRSSPTIDSDGTIYIGAYSITDYMGHIYAINPDGTQKWMTDPLLPIDIDYSSIAISSTGTLYVGSFNSKLHAIDPSDGTITWEYLTDGATNYSSPAIATDGTIYIVSNLATLYAINSNGTLKWTYSIPESYHSSPGSPVMANDGTIIIATTDAGYIGHITAINPNGTFKWTYTMMGKSGYASPSIGPNDVTYIGDNLGYFYAIDIGGIEIYAVKNFDNSITSPPAFSQDNSTIYIGAGPSPLGYEGSGLYALDINTGNIIWYYPTPRQERCPPVVDTNGIIYVGDDNYPDPTFYAINPNGTLKWSVTAVDRIRMSPAIAADGTIYFGDRDNNFYAYTSITTPWPKFHHDKKNTGQSPYPSYTDGTLDWIFATTGEVRTNPTIDSDGTVYIADSNGYIYALNPDGTLKWSLSTAYIFDYSSPIIGPDGTIYIGSDNLLAINPNGSLKWVSDELLYIFASSGTILSNGNICIGSTSLFCINPVDGTAIWSYPIEIRSSPAIGIDGTIYITSTDNNLYAINPNGTLKWMSDDYVYAGYSSPAIGPYGTIYMFGDDGYLYAIDPSNGYLIGGNWPYNTEYIYDSYQTTPAISSNGTIYVSINNEGILLAINPDGTLKWSYVLGVSLWASSPAISSDGTIFVGGYGKIFAINPDGTLKWSTNSTDGGECRSPSIASDGTVYIPSLYENDGYSRLYAFKSLVTISCPISLKYEGDNIHLSATPKDGIGPYYVKFIKTIEGVDTILSYYTDAPEDIEIPYDYTLTNEDIRTAYSGTIDFSVFISDSCPTTPQTCTDTCSINIGCVAPVCNFTVT